METLKWLFELIDQVSGPARQIRSALEAARGALESVPRGAKPASDALATAKTASGSAAKAVESVGKASAQTAPLMTKLASEAKRVGSEGHKAASQWHDLAKGLGGSAGNVAEAFGAAKGGGGFLGVGAALGGWTAVVAGAAFAVEALVAGVVDLAKGMGRLAWAGGKFAIDALSFKESTLASFKVMLGTEEAAGRIFAQAAELANKTPLQMADVLGGYKRLMAAGFTAEEVPLVFQAVGDVSAFNNFSSEVIGSMARAFGQIKGKGKLQLEEMNQVFEAAGGAIRRSDVFEAIAKHIGVGVGAVDRAISAGQVSDQVGILSILEAIQKASGGAVGGMMKEQGQTLAGLLSTLVDAPRAFFLAMDPSSMPGFSTFKGFVQNVIDLFDVAKGSGRETMQLLQDVFNDAFGGLFSDLSGPGGAGKLREILSDVISWARQAYAVIEGIAGGVVEFARGFHGEVASFLALFSSQGGAQVQGFAETMRELGSVLGPVAGALMNVTIIGAKFFTSVIAPIWSALVAILAVIGAIVAAIPAAVGSLVNLVAPGTVSEKWTLGGVVNALGAKLELPGFAAGGHVTRPTLAMVGEAGPETIIPDSQLARIRGGGGGATISVGPITIVIEGAGKSADEISAQLCDRLPSVLADALEGLAIEGGAA